MKKVNKKRALALVGKGAMLVDMRSPVDFRDGSVPGAQNLPLKNFLNKIVGMNRKQKFVLFARDIEDADMKNAANYAEQLGFEELFVSEYKQLIKEDEENDKQSKETV